MRTLLFPGEARIWRWSLLAIVPLSALIVWQLLLPRNFYTETNSVGQRSQVATLQGGQTLCEPQVPVVAGTARVQFGFTVIGRQLPVTLHLTLSAGGRVLARGSYHGIPGLLPAHTTVALDRTFPAGLRPTFTTLCLTTSRSSPPIGLGGYGGTPTVARPLTVDGHPQPFALGVWLLPRTGVERSLASDWPTIMRRLSVFRPGFESPVFLWVVLLGGLPLLVYFAIRLLAVSPRLGRLLPLGVAALALASAALWALTTVAFDSPDESEHFAYTEYLVETGKAPAPLPGVTTRPIYASDELLGLRAIHQFSVITTNDTRTPWLPAQDAAWKRQLAAQHPARDDGGGFGAAIGAPSPLYYAVLGPGYAVGRGSSTFAELFWMRLTSALLAAVVALAAFLTMRELVPTRPELAAAAGALVALEPMFSYIGGAVNNDNGVNAMAALAVLLTVRALRRGLSVRLGFALGLVVFLMPTMKGTGLALWPAIAVALALVVIRDRAAALRGALAAAGGFLLVLVPWALLAPHFHRGVLGLPSNIGATGAGGSLGGKLTYLWEVFLPRLPFMAAHWPPGHPWYMIYIKRAFAVFGWYAEYFPNAVYVVLVAVLAVLGLLALSLAVTPQTRGALLARWRELLFLALVIAGVIAGVEFAYYSATPRPWQLMPEQGRYIFPALVPLVCLALVGLARLPRNWRVATAAVLVGAMGCFEVASHLLYLTYNYT